MGLPAATTLADASDAVREELLAVKFSKPGNAPRKMICCIPAPLPHNPTERQRFKSKHYESLIMHVKSDAPAVGPPAGGAPHSEHGVQFLRYISKSPVWDARRQTFTINFYGKVRQPSSKNFQLIDAVGGENPLVQFGRWTEEIFSLDGMWPFSIVQVFALALSTFDTRFQEALKMTY